MELLTIAKTYFGRTPTHLSGQAVENTQKLLDLMKKSTIYSENIDHTNWQANILSRLSMGKKLSFIDNSAYNCYSINNKNKKEMENIADCTIRIGSKIININSYTGKIISYKIDWFNSLNKFIVNTEKCIEKFLEDFNDSEVVTKHHFPIGGKNNKKKKVFYG